MVDNRAIEPKDLSFVPYRLAAQFILNKLQTNRMPLPKIGIICGSGLSRLSQTLQEPTVTIPYADLPGFPPHCTVPGHVSEVVFGSLANGIPAVCFRGRFHFYEGHDMKTVALPVRVMRCLNVPVCILTNASGGLNPDLRVGDILCVSDHVALPQLVGINPLIGPNDDELGPRFPATSDAYDEELRRAAMVAADTMGIIDSVRPQGVYCFVSGPMYESKAECRLLRSLGGDAVGMSTIPEVIAAHHCNMKTLVLSLVSAVIVTDNEGEPPTHEEVLEAMQGRSEQLKTLVTHIAAHIRDSRSLEPLPDVTLRVSLAAKRRYLAAQRHARTKDNSRGLSCWWPSSSALSLGMVTLLAAGVGILFQRRRTR